MHSFSSHHRYPTNTENPLILTHITATMQHEKMHLNIFKKIKGKDLVFGS